MEKETYSQKRTDFRKKNIEELLELLASENLQTRFFAEMTLRDLSGT